MRVLLVNQCYRPDTAATGQLLADLAEGLVVAGHEVHVICSRRPYAGGGDDVGPPEEVIDGVHVHRVGASGCGHGSPARRLADYGSFFGLALWRALTLKRADVCVSLTTPPFVGLVGSALSAVRGTRQVLWTMDLYPEVAVALGVLRRDGAARRVLAWLSRRLYQQTDAIVSLGERMTGRLRDAGAPSERVATVHNWVPGEAVVPTPRLDSRLAAELGDAGGVTLMYAGNLGRGHELATAVRAVARVDPALGLRLLVVGEGAMRAPLDEWVAEMRLDNVTLLPPRPLAELSDLLAAGDIHLVCQKPETQGLIVPSKLYGVMAAGRPTLFIGPDDCEVAGILRRSEAGLVVPPGDDRAAGAALSALIRDPRRRVTMGRCARQYYVRHFGRRRSVGRIMAVVQDAAARAWLPQTALG